jgi:amino acid adenylation domain-containing protein
MHSYTSLYQFVKHFSEVLPDKTALVYKDIKISYVQLYNDTLSLAALLKTSGVVKGDRVIQIVEKGPDMITAIVALSMVGAVYCPFHPNDPIERLQNIVIKSEAKTILTTADFESKFVLQGVKTVVINYSTISENLLSLDQIYQNDVCYIISTSGSTGTPKLVQIPNSNILNLLQGMISEANWTQDERVLQLARCSFDAQIIEIYCTLMLGATIIIPHHSWIYNINYLAKLIIKENVTSFFMVPTLVDAFVDSVLKITDWLPSVHCAILGGEAVFIEKVKKLSQVIKLENIYNGYGPTECTVFTSFYKVKDYSHPTLPLGKPLPGYDCKIIDEILHVSGKGLMKGYLNEPKQPFIEIDNTVFYNTGDRVELIDGELIYQGRVDFQVKINGQRIDLGDIESNIMKIEGVTNCVVCKKILTGSDTLVAYVESVQVKESEVKSVCKSGLPAYMVPRHVVVLESFPLNLNGKVDRKALRDPIISFE